MEPEKPYYVTDGRGVGKESICPFCGKMHPVETVPPGIPIISCPDMPEGFVIIGKEIFGA